MPKYTPPPKAIYLVGKKKEQVTKAINLLNGLKKDLANNPVILKAIDYLKEYRNDLEQL
jgi:hypothetical protein